MNYRIRIYDPAQPRVVGGENLSLWVLAPVFLSGAALLALVLAGAVGALS